MPLFWALGHDLRYMAPLHQSKGLLQLTILLGSLWQVMHVTAALGMVASTGWTLALLAALLSPSIPMWDNKHV